MEGSRIHGWYRRDEGDIQTIRQDEEQEKLILYFKAQEKESWILRDIASFITSEVQAIFPEYHCGGKKL